MVPYVRKSFYKHYKDGLVYIEKLSKEMVDHEIGTDAVTEISIYDTSAYCFDGAAKYAMDMTVKEIYQAVEGMFHNLNTLQSRSGNQLNWWLLMW